MSDLLEMSYIYESRVHDITKKVNVWEKSSGSSDEGHSLVSKWNL